MNPFDRAESEPDSNHPFVIDSETKASWALGKIATVEGEIARVKAQSAERLAQLQTEAGELHARFDADLQAWAEGESARRGRKSVTLLDGTLAFRTVPGRFSIVDKDAAFAHAQQEEALRNCVDIVLSLNTSAYLEEAKASGEMLPGIDWIPEKQSFSIKFAGNSDKPEKRFSDHE